MEDIAFLPFNRHSEQGTLVLHYIVQGLSILLTVPD